MVVVDAAVIVDALLDISADAELLRRRLARGTSECAAPELMDAEVAHVVRRRVLRGELSSAAGEAALADLVAMRIERHSHLPLLHRAFELRDNATIYDALYLALAEVLEATLLTRDRALARVPGVSAAVEVVGSG
jgi:predicted nucleic acid-binding protein